MISGKKERKKDERNSPCGCSNSCCFATEDQQELHWTGEGRLQCGGLAQVHWQASRWNCASRPQAPQLSGVLDLHHSALFLHWRSVPISLLDLHDDPLEDLHSGLQWMRFIGWLEGDSATSAIRRAVLRVRSYLVFLRWRFHERSSPGVSELLPLFWLNDPEKCNKNLKQWMRDKLLLQLLANKAYFIQRYRDTWQASTLFQD